VTTVTAARAGGEADAMRFSRLFVVAVLVDLGVSGIAAASGSAHRQGRMLALPAAQQICPSDPAVPLVEPEAREVMNVGAAQQIANGTGIKVGIIADGIDVNLPDLIRTGGQHVDFDYQDFSGFGTGAPTDGRQAFLAAGIIASQGRQTYDLSGFVNPAHPLPPGCNIRIQGIAPGSSLAVLNVAGSNPRALNSQIAEAIRYAVNVDQVDVLDEPFVANPIPDTQDDPVSLANQAAVTAGVTVVVGSGDAGPFDDIGAPATSAGVISVGGTTTYRLYRQTTRYGTQLSSGGWENDNISALGSSGITAFNPGTVSVVAPADSGWSLCGNDTTAFFGCADIDRGSSPQPIFGANSTGASAAATSATAALVLQAYAQTHAGSLPSPALVKRIIVSTATDLGAPAEHQGAGLVNALKAVQLAESIGTTGRQGSTLLVSQSALSATVNAGHAHDFGIKVTNEGSSAQTITPAVSGRPTTRSTDTGALTLSSASPTLIDGEGRTDFFAVHTFAVPSGVDNLNGDVTWNAQAIGGVAFLTLLDTNGAVAAYSFLGTNRSGFGHVEVRRPSAGTWTAVISTVSTAPYFGSVKFAFSSEAFQQAGSVSPGKLTLSPGKSGTFRVRVTAGQPGDEALSLHLGTGGSDDGSIPIVVRSLVPLAKAGGSFSGILTGGAADGTSGQTVSYQFKVSGGKPSLGVRLALADPNYNVEGFLVDPRGQPVDIQSTAALDANDNFLGFAPELQFFRDEPAPGLWTLTLLAAGPVDGAHLSEPYTGAVSFDGPTITSSGLPTKPSTVLPAGQPVTATVTVTNTGSIRKDFFVDARLRGVVQQQLLGSNANSVSLPLSLFAAPTWFVPTGTKQLTVTGQGTVPITMDVSAAQGDPDALGVASGTKSVATLSTPELAPGFFVASPAATGPFGAGGVGGGATLQLTAVAKTNPFDSAVTATTGDVWALSVNPVAPYTPLSLAPSESGTITLTITPNATKGTVVRGFVAVDTFNLFTDSGDELSTIPYSYRVG
jgi:hypothetical protein